MISHRLLPITVASALLALLLSACAGARLPGTATAQATPCAKPLGVVRHRVQSGNLLYTVTENFLGNNSPITPTNNSQTTAEYDQDDGGCR